MTQQTFAELIGISAGSLSSIFSERTKPTLNIVDAIMTKFTNLNLEWLMYGRGSMFKDGEENNNKTPALPFSASENGAQVPAGNVVSSPLSSLDGMRNAAQTGGISAPQYADLKYFDKQKRNITEIRIFFDDQTWETFVPKK